MWQRIIAVILIGAGFFTILFFRKYSGELIPYPVLFYGLGVLSVLLGFLLLRNSVVSAKKNQQKSISDAVNSLKLNSEKIIVDLSKCEIKEHHYKEEPEISEDPNTLLHQTIEHHLPILGVASLISNSKTEKVNVVQTVLIYNHHNNRTGEIERFISRIIAKDEITISFYLDRQKQTTLYVDTQNRNRYYFDLDFLNS